MKIALVCPASLPATQFGGILFLCVDLARELSEIGHEIKIFTTDMDFANNPKSFNKKLPRKEKIGKFEIIRSHVWFSIQLFFVNPGMYFQMMKDESEIIHTIGVRSFQSFIAAIISKKKNIPLIISDQGGLTTHPDLKKNGVLKNIMYEIQKPMMNYVIKNAKKIIVANEYEEKIFAELNASKKTVIVKNGINLMDFKDPKNNFKKKYSIEKPFILFVGRFNKVKGIDTLIQSLIQIKNEKLIKEIKVVIMGVDFGFQNEMLKMIKDNHLEEIIQIIKNPPREDVISAYESSEFLVLPSRWELSPLTPLEGFAFKKAVISTKAHGIPFTISDNENAILVEPNNPKKLSEAILTLVKDEDKKIKLGLSGFKLVQDICNSKNMAKNTLEVYNSLITKTNKTNKT